MNRPWGFIRSCRGSQKPDEDRLGGSKLATMKWLYRKSQCLSFSQVSPDHASIQLDGGGTTLQQLFWFKPNQQE